MIRYLLLCFGLSLCFFWLPASAVDVSPVKLPIFQQGRTVDISAQESAPIPKSPWRKIRRYQKEWQSTLHEQIQQFKEGFAIWWLLSLFGIAFIYGVLHALGPGHGKAIISAYLLQNEAHPSVAIKLSALVAFTHTGSAILIGIFMQTILLSLRGIQAQMVMQRYFSLASSTLIMAIGMWLLYRNLRQKETSEDQTAKQSNTISIGLAAGMIPCPVSLTIIMLSTSYGMFIVGLTAVLGISLGMAVLLLGIGFLVIHSRGKVLSVLEKRPRVDVKKIIKIIHYVSSMLIILLGIITFLFFY